MSYPKNTLLRYYPSNSAIHYTAVVSKKGIFQVKPGHASFPTVQEWLATLPGQPTQDKLQVAEKRVPLTWKIQRLSYPQSNRYQTWTEYLYKAIMKTNKTLKTNAEMCQAFNHLSDVLVGFNDKFCIYINRPRRITQYMHLTLHNHNNSPQVEWNRLPVIFYPVKGYGRHVMVEDRQTFAPQVWEAYKPLYELMEQHGVLRMARECNIRVELSNLYRQRGRMEITIQHLEYKKNQVETEQANLHLRMEKIKERIAGFEDELQRNRQSASS